MSQTVEIIVSPTGQSQVKTSGFSGTSCQTASLPFEKALGIKQAAQLLAEFYAEQPAEARLEEGH